MSVIQKRKKETALRKNTKLIIFLTLFFWVVLACVIFFVDPYSPGAKLSFFIFLFSAAFITFSTLFVHTRRGLLAGIFVVVFMLLRLWGVGTLFNASLLLALLFIIELYMNLRSNT